MTSPPNAISSGVSFLSLFTSPNQQTLAQGLFTTAARKRGATVASVLHEVAIQFTTRCFRALGETDGVAYHSSLVILRDNRAAAERYARLLLADAQASLFPVKANPSFSKRQKSFTGKPSLTTAKGGRW